MKWNREDLKAWTKIPTRWMDDDIYGHVNNVVYYSYFDTAVNGNLIRVTGQDIRSQDAIGIVVESGCTFHRELSFPQVIEAGLLVEKMVTAVLPTELDFLLKRIRNLPLQGILCMSMSIVKIAGLSACLKIYVKR